MSATLENEGQVGLNAPWQVIELNGRGHRLWYVSLLLRRIEKMESAPKVQLVTCADVVDLPAWKEHVEPWMHLLEPVSVSVEESRRVILRAAAGAGATIIIPDADMWLPSLLAVRFRSRRSLSGSILLMRPSPDSALISRWRHLVKSALTFGVRLVHPNMRVCSLLAVPERGAQTEVLDPVEFMPSSLERDGWLRKNGLDPGIKWLAVLGEISERKCVGTVARAMMSMEARRLGWGLIIVGNTSDEPLVAELMRLAASRPERIVCRREFLTDADFDNWIANADAISVLYRNEGSSGVLLKCWAAGAAVLVGGSAVVLKASRELDMNCVVVDELSAEAILRALTKISPFSIGQPPESSDWQQRSSEFAEKLLGLEPA